MVVCYARYLRPTVLNVLHLRCVLTCQKVCIRYVCEQPRLPTKIIITTSSLSSLKSSSASPAHRRSVHLLLRLLLRRPHHLHLRHQHDHRGLPLHPRDHRTHHSRHHNLPPRLPLLHPNRRPLLHLSPQRFLARSGHVRSVGTTSLTRWVTHQWLHFCSRRLCPACCCTMKYEHAISKSPWRTRENIQTGLMTPNV